MSDQDTIQDNEDQPLHNPELMEFADGLEQQLQRDNATELQQANEDQLAESRPVIEASAMMINKVITGAVAIAEKRFAGISQIWTETVISDTADAAAAVMVKYDLSAPEFVGKYKEEIHLVMTVAPPLFGTWMMTKLMLEAEQQARRKAEREITPGLAQSAS